jgi:PII-like signaling protein
MIPRLEKRKLVCVFMGEHDLYKDKPLYHAITMRLRQEQFHGISVIKGIEGFGPHSLMRKSNTGNLLNISADPPIVIYVVEKEDRVDRLLEILDEMMIDGEVFVTDVEGVSYLRSKDKTRV